MNIIIFNVLKNLFSFIFICFISVSSYSLNGENINIYNYDKNKITNMTNKIVKYNTITKYNYDLPEGEKKVLTEGQNGIMFLDSNNNYVVLQEKIDKLIEVGIDKSKSFSGVLTAYGPDCASCDGKGYVSCPLLDGSNFSLVSNGMYYNDATYGNVRVLSADLRGFPCGSIVEIENDQLGEVITGIVLDTGYSMKKAYDQGSIHIDLAFQSQKDINISTNNKTNFNVKRLGW